MIHARDEHFVSQAYAKRMATRSRVDEMTLSGLRVCREIALLGSFSAAARSLGYSQPAISRQVAAMEAAAGMPLFVRETRGVRLSAAGTAVVNHAGRILGDVDSLGRDLEGLGDRLVGRLRMGVFPTAAAVLAPRAIAHLASEHPGLSVRLSEASTPTLLGELRNGRLAVAVIAAGTGLPSYDLDGLEVRRIPAGDLCVAVWAGHRLATRARPGRAPAVPVDELTGERWVIGVGDRGDPQFTAWPTLREPVIAHRARSWPSRLGLVAAGLGICVIPELAAASAPEGVTMVRVDDPGWPGRVTLAVTRANPGAEVRAALDSLESAGIGIRADTRGSD